jgi:hypothetical protein
LLYLYPALSRNDLSYVAGEFRIFDAIFLKDGCSLFKRHINLSELGKILLCQVLNFVGGRLLLSKGGRQCFFQKVEALGFGSFDGWGFGPTTALTNAVSASTILVIPEGRCQAVEKNMGRAD